MIATTLDEQFDIQNFLMTFDDISFKILIRW